MKKFIKLRILLISVCILQLVLISACQNRSTNSVTQESRSEVNVDDSVQKYNERLVNLSAELKSKSIKNKEVNGHLMFTRGPLAEIGAERLPFVIFRILPELAMQLESTAAFGTEEKQFSSFGFFFDRRPMQKGWPVPQGFTFSMPTEKSPSKISYMIRTCSSCHVGRVLVNEKIRLLDGASNHEMDLHKFNAAMIGFLDKSLRKSNRDKTKAAILKLLELKPTKWFFNEQSSFNKYGDYLKMTDQQAKNQIQLVIRDIDRILEIVFQVNQKRLAASNQLTKTFNRAKAGRQPSNYGPAGIVDSNASGIVGILSAFNAAHPNKTIPIEIIYPGTTKVSIPSVWQQQRRKSAQWDASVPNIFFRNAIAAMGFVSSPADLSAINLSVVSNYISTLPSPRYPFAIDSELAAKGKAVYKKAGCGDCHKSFQKELPKIYNMGTSMNRARSVSNEIIPKVVLGALMQTCTKNSENASAEISIDNQKDSPCNVKPESIMIPRIKPDEQGYPATPLDGIWARAPYLNNGSVPTLYHLLAWSNKSRTIRPRKFSTGNLNYDNRKVGWVWNDTSSDNVYNTSLDGFSNQGHSASGNSGVWEDQKTKETYKLNWNIDDEQELAELQSLLEYLKTM